jgi:hypothetical protein
MSMANAQGLLEEVQEFSKKYADDLRSGKISSLISFEAKVTNLCDAVSALPKTESQKYEKDLKGIINQLGEWSEMLLKYQGGLKDDIEELNNQLRAKKAYDSVARQYGNDNAE